MALALGPQTAASIRAAAKRRGDDPRALAAALLTVIASEPVLLDNLLDGEAVADLAEPAVAWMGLSLTPMQAAGLYVIATTNDGHPVRISGAAIARQVGADVHHASGVFTALIREGLIECVEVGCKRGAAGLYRLTDFGKWAASALTGDIVAAMVAGRAA
ncbi:hypothetical protein CSC94_05995 [Zhengella mangrovi]|uniref:Uncharacterized protein n=2 Tax=Zhengella mangrovi TaxID=1982044 RepID=A0A2G1QRT0_9HYPH|nr:hypothetical protein CSC94_05995 [Zhengella mangrovi]